MPGLLERNREILPTETSVEAGPSLTPPRGSPVDAATQPTGWPTRAKALVAVLIVTTVLGAIGTVVGFDSGEDLSVDVERLELEVATLTTQRDDARASADLLEADLVDERSRVETAEANAEAIAGDAAELNSTVASLSSELESAQRATDQMQSQVATLTAERDDARTIIDQLETDLVHGVVSSGDGIEVATPYPSEGSIHPVAMVAGEATDVVAKQVPSSWTPANVFETELIAQVGESAQSVIEECPYNGPNIIRYRYATAVTLYSATSGQQIADVTLRGADPRECQQSEPWDLTELHGEAVSTDEIISWLDQYVVTG